MKHELKLLTKTLNQIGMEVSTLYSVPFLSKINASFTVDIQSNPEYPYSLYIIGTPEYQSLVHFTKTSLEYSEPTKQLHPITLEELITPCIHQIEIGLENPKHKFAPTNIHILRIRDAIGSDFAELVKLENSPDLSEQFRMCMKESIHPALPPHVLESPYFKRIENHPVVRESFFSHGEVKLVYSKYQIRIPFKTIIDILRERFPEYPPTKIFAFADTCNIHEKVKDLVTEYDHRGANVLEKYAFLVELHPYTESPGHITTAILAMHGSTKRLLFVDSIARNVLEWENYQGLSSILGLEYSHTRVRRQFNSGACGMHSIVDALTGIDDPNIIQKINALLEFDKAEKYLAEKIIRLCLKLERFNAKNNNKQEHLKEKLVEYLVCLSAMHYTKSPEEHNRGVTYDKLKMLFDFGLTDLQELPGLMSLVDSYPKIIFLNNTIKKLDPEDVEKSLHRLFADPQKMGHIRQVLSGNNPITEFTKSRTVPNLNAKEAKTRQMLTMITN